MTVYGGEAVGGPDGLSYAGVLVRADRGTVLRRLAELRFTGWVGPQQDAWVVAVPAAAGGQVAAGRRRVEDVARDLAAGSGSTALAVRVERDRLLVLSAYAGAAEVTRYVSDPSAADPADEMASMEPAGAEDAPALAAACGAPEAADDLAELLAEELGESVNESERLRDALRLLRLPDWLVASDSLPRDVPGGPRASEVTRLGAGRTGLAGVAAGRAARVVRRRG